MKLDISEIATAIEVGCGAIVREANDFHAVAHYAIGLAEAHAKDETNDLRAELSRLASQLRATQEALGEDTAGVPLPELLRDAARILVENQLDGLPIVQRLRFKADDIDAACRAGRAEGLKLAAKMATESAESGGVAAKSGSFALLELVEDLLARAKEVKRE